MKNVNAFELVVDTRVEKLDGKIREVSQRIKIDDVEINQQYAGETKVLFEKSGYRNVEVRKDISGNERMLKATL